MATVAEFLGNALFSRFIAPKYPTAVVDMFLSIAAIELDEHRAFMGIQFNLISFLLSAHRLTKWSSAGLLAGTVADVSVLPISEMRQIVSSLSVSDEAGSESITFQQKPASPTIDPSSEDFASTEFGVLYLTLFKKFKCPRSWAVVGSTGSAYSSVANYSTAYYGTPVPVVIPPVSAITGGGEFIVRFGYGDSTPKILNVPITGLVDRVLIGIDVPFNVPSTLSIGTTANPSLLMAIGQNAPTEVGQFESTPSVELINQHIILTIAPGSGISQGSGFVIIEYSIP